MALRVVLFLDIPMAVRIRVLLSLLNFFTSNLTGNASKLDIRKASYLSFMCKYAPRAVAAVSLSFHFRVNWFQEANYHNLTVVLPPGAVFGPNLLLLTLPTVRK